MATLTKAHHELFRRQPDECFDSFEDMHQHCLASRDDSRELWQRPQDLTITHDMTVVDEDGWEKQLNDWSFSQMCRLAGVSKETINRLSSKTASRALQETMPCSDKPLQVLSTDDQIRSMHGVAYTRLWNSELLDVVSDFTSDFMPPQKAVDNQSTGLYCGEQDLFAFLIDPAGWTEIDGEAFAPGFFVWNSEVGKRSLGIQSFWFQRVCQNHIVWDATQVVDFNRKHTANVRDGLGEIRRIIEALANRRDQRRDSFSSVIKSAMSKKLGDGAEEVATLLSEQQIPRGLIKQAMEIARHQGGYTIFALVDALSRLSQRVQLAGDRTHLDAKIGKLLALAV